MYGGSGICAVFAHYKTNPGKVEESITIVESFRSELKQIAGLKEVIDIYNEEGGGCSVMIWDSAEAKAAAAGKMEEVWARLEGIFETVEEEEYEKVEYLVP